MKLKIHFEKLASHDRDNEICHISIPFGVDQLISVNQLVIEEADGTAVDTQLEALSYWQNGSIRWVSVYFLAHLPANHSKEYFAIISSPTSDYAKDVTSSVIESPIIISVNENQVISFKHEHHQLTFNSQHTLIDSEGLTCITQFDNTTFTTSQKGPLRLTHHIQGSHDFISDLDSGESTRLDFELTLIQNRHQPWIQVDYRLINSNDYDLHLKNITVRLTPNINQTTIQRALATSNYKSQIRVAKDSNPLQTLIDGPYLLQDANEHFPETFYGTAWADWYDSQSNSGLCATHFQAYQNFPKALQSDTLGLSLELLPTMSDPLCLPAGVAKTHTYFLHFHGNHESTSNYSDILIELNRQSLQFQMPDRPRLDPHVYQASKALDDIYSKVPSFDMDQSMINKADKRSRGYGILNWGDAPDMNYTNQGRGNGHLVWTNNEYDFPHAAMLLYTKTGVRRILDYCLVSARHQIDVDVCHSPALGLRYQGQIEHSAHHTTGDVKPCHQWVEGLLDYYHLTGDRTSYETAIGIGDNILQLLTLPRYEQSGGISARETGWAMRSLLALYKETWDEKWLMPTHKIIEQFKQWHGTYGGWLAPYTDHSVIRVPFMIAVAVGSLMRYYKLFPEDSVRELILNAVDDLCENCLLPDGSFFYKELPSLQRPSHNPLVLEALAYAYELTSNTKYLRAGLKTFEHLGQDGTSSDGKKLYDTYTLVTGGTGPKAFAQSYHALALFHKYYIESSL